MSSMTDPGAKFYYNQTRSGGNHQKIAAKITHLGEPDGWSHFIHYPKMHYALHAHIVSLFKSNSHLL